jgi:hypothetical protein
MKILKTIFIITSLIIVGFFIYKNLYDNGFFMNKKEKYFYSKLRDFKKSGKDYIELRELTNFEWDAVSVFSSYSPLKNEGLLIFYLNDKEIAIINGYQKVFQHYLGNSNLLFTFNGQAKRSAKKLSLKLKINKLNWSISGYEIYGITIY